MKALKSLMMFVLAGLGIVSMCVAQKSYAQSTSNTEATMTQDAPVASDMNKTGDGAATSDQQQPQAVDQGVDENAPPASVTQEENDATQEINNINLGGDKTGAAATDVQDVSKEKSGTDSTNTPGDGQNNLR